MLTSPSRHSGLNSFARLLACSGPQTSHPDFTYWETSWLLAGLCTHRSFLRRGCGGRELSHACVSCWCGAPGTMGPWPWDLGNGPGSHTAKYGQRSSFLPCLLLTIQEFNWVSFWLQTVRSKFPSTVAQRCYNTLPSAVHVITHRKKTYVISSPQEEWYSPLKLTAV